MTELSVVGIRITGPTYNKPVIIRKQIYVPLKISSYYNEIVLFVIPHLTVEIILGTDWLTRNGAVINYVHETIALKNKFLDKEVVLFNKNRLGNIKMDINIIISNDIVIENENNVNKNMENHVKYDEENNDNYVSIRESITVNENREDEGSDNEYKEIKNIKNISNIFVVNAEVQKEELNYNKNSESKLSMVQQIRLIIQKINTLDSNQKNKLEHLLVKHKNIFMLITYILT